MTRAERSPMRSFGLAMTGSATGFGWLVVAADRLAASLPPEGAMLVGSVPTLALIWLACLAGGALALMAAAMWVMTPR